MYAVILSLIFAAAVGVAAYGFGKLKAELNAERGWRKELQRRNTELENHAGPIGYKQMQAFDELTAYLVGIEKRSEIARDIANAAKRGNWNPE